MELSENWGWCKVHPSVFLEQFLFPWDFKMRFDQFLGHIGGLPVNNFLAVTLWRPLEQMSPEAILY